MALWFSTGYQPSLQPRKHFFNWQIFEKWAKFVRNAKSIITFFLMLNCVSNHIGEWHLVPKRKNFDFIFICSEITAQTRWSVSIVALHHLPQRKQCDSFWLLGAKSFPTVYYMLDFAAIISSCHYTYTKQDINKIKEGIQLISSGGLCHCERLLRLVLLSLHFPLFTCDFLFFMVHYEKHVERYVYCCR